MEITAVPAVSRVPIEIWEEILDKAVYHLDLFDPPIANPDTDKIVGGRLTEVHHESPDQFPVAFNPIEASVYILEGLP